MLFCSRSILNTEDENEDNVSLFLWSQIASKEASRKRNTEAKKTTVAFFAQQWQSRKHDSIQNALVRLTAIIFHLVFDTSAVSNTNGRLFLSFLHFHVPIHFMEQQFELNVNWKIFTTLRCSNLRIYWRMTLLFTKIRSKKMGSVNRSSHSMALQKAKTGHEHISELEGFQNLPLLHTKAPSGNDPIVLNLYALGFVFWKFKKYL